MRNILLICFMLSLSACESLPSHAPSVLHHSISRDGIATTQGIALTWALENLNPDEGTILIDGKPTAFSIDLKLSGPTSDTSQYLVQFLTSKNQFHPFVVQTVGEGGDLTFSGKVTWFLNVSGVSEIVTMALYRVDRSTSNKTITKTLLADVRRTYQVICDEDEFFLKLALKKLLCLCVSKSSSLRKPHSLRKSLSVALPSVREGSTIGMANDDRQE